MDKKKKIIAIGILGVLICVFLLLNSYAYWKVEKKDQFVNRAASACLSITYNDLTDRIYIPDAWPTSDEDGLASRAYEFSVENTCDYDVRYEVVLESLVTTAKKYMNYNDIKIQYDNSHIYRFEDLTNEDNDPDATGIRHTKFLTDGVVEGHRTKEHSLRIWLASDASLDARGKEFEARVKVYAGDVNDKEQTKYTDSSCFGIYDDGLLYAYHKNDTNCSDNLVIPARINGITVTRIRKDFHIPQPKTLSNLDISNLYGLTEIGDSAFTSYIGTDKDLIIPDTVTSIGQSTFVNYVGGTLSLPDNLIIVNDKAFDSYSGDSLVLPSKLEIIGSRAFTNYNGSSITLPNGLQQIGALAFMYYVGSGSDLVIPDSVTSIGTSAFQMFNGKSLKLSSNLTKIPPAAFSEYRGIGTDLIIPDSVTIIDGAFGNFRGNSIKFPSNLTTIGRWSFRYYNGADIVLPSTITSIGQQAFFDSADSINKNKTIYINKPNLDGVELGTNWHGWANVKCLVSENHYEDCPGI